ncbi:LOW QUALITY PROTEIN: insulin receptor substrate 4 [Pyrgilauda ruficollis]|uniref:LOW QUALITY PROTEIN: insulin receptor substrate 4 n=1 Tax=Pyrgilauda ruficollis TaxID=221976 RepID=UPI001B8830CC|nr:LOW QUALITY PROTEIN: insulin receptor substrate 4 [Pyrgilauda ruficollis]
MPRLPPYSRRRIHSSPASPPPSVCEARIGCRTDRSTLLPIAAGPASFPSTGNTPADRGQPGAAAASHWSAVLSVLCSPASPDRAQRSPPLLLLRPLIGSLAKDCRFLLALPLPLWRAARSARRCPLAPRARAPPAAAPPSAESRDVFAAVLPPPPVSASGRSDRGKRGRAGGAGSTARFPCTGRFSGERGFPLPALRPVPGGTGPCVAPKMASGMNGPGGGGGGGGSGSEEEPGARHTGGGAAPQQEPGVLGAAAGEGEPAAGEGGRCPSPQPHHLLLLLRRSPSASLCPAPEAAPAGRGAGEDVRKCGYLRKQKHGHKRYFVLRAESHLAPARLEYYDSEKKFKSSLRAAGAGGAAALCCPPPKRVIPLYQCFTVSRRADAKHKHIIALYTKDEYFAMLAENDAEQEAWYQAISELMNQSKRGFLEQEDHADQQVDDDDEHYGATLRPGTVFKEVWQVNVKPKGLGQTKNLTGVYRLCLSSKAIHLVKLNSEVPSVHLQLMNIRRCGHSENFFFIEVGRSASIGPGELWMQVDDSVVAQNMHETFLDTMKALKAFAEFRPRSKSQSSGGGSGTNPISFITTRRHLGNLPPSQTGLQRRSRTESVAGGTPPTTKSNNSYRFRTSSEGEGTMTRPFRSVTGSLIHLNTARMNLGRQEGSGRYVRAAFSSSYHTRSASLPVSHFPSTTSPISVSSSSGHGSASDMLTRPSSSSVCGSPSDGGFISSDEYGSSPGDFRYFRVRSNTPDSLGNTPPIREENCLSEYMSMNKQQGDDGSRDDYMEAEKCFRKRAYSLTKPASVAVQQKTTQTTALLDEDSAGNHGRLLYSETPKLKDNNELEYSDTNLDSTCNQSRSKARDDGYMPMMPGVASSLSSTSDYLPMTPKSMSVPKQINNSWSPSQVDSRGYMMMFPKGSSSPVRSPLTGFASKGSNEKIVNNEYMDMSPGNSVPKHPSDSNYIHTTSVSKGFSSYFSLPRSFKALSGQNGDHSEYVPMSSPGKLLYGAPENVKGVSSETLANGISKLPTLKGSDEGLVQSRAARPTRLPLGTRGSNTIPRMYDRTVPPEPASPGEYINIDFNEKASNTPYSLSAEGSPSSLGSSSDHRQSPLSDYMSVDLDVQSPKAAKELSNSLTDISIYASSSIPRNQPNPDYARLSFGAACVSTASNRTDDYTEMTFNMAATPPRPFATESDSAVKMDSPSSIVNRLCIVDRYAGSSSFSVPSSDPPIGPKVIRADPQGRRRHSSETFSSAGTVTTSSSFFTDSSKRHSSASFDNVWLKPDENISDGQENKMSRDTSTGFQNGLNYIALNLRDDPLSCEASTTAPACHLQNGTSGLDSGAYVSIDFSRSDGLKCNARKD